MNIAECKTIIPNQDNYDDNDNHDEHIHPNHDLGYVPGNDLNNHIYHNLYPGFDSGEDHDDYNNHDDHDNHDEITMTILLFILVVSQGIIMMTIFIIAFFLIMILGKILIIINHDNDIHNPLHTG